jgi:DNA-binding YbaB/EbfC family protein
MNDDQEPVAAELIEDSEVLDIDVPGVDAGGFDLGSMLQMAQQAATQVAEAQEELLGARVSGSAGGGAVRVVLNGHLHLLEVEIAPEAVDPDDPSMLGDLVVAAFADAQQQVAALQSRSDPLAGLGDLGGLLGGG